VQAFTQKVELDASDPLKELYWQIQGSGIEPVTDLLDK
jgi:hypothetical protein